jgi:mono/diheme cytochrome c family protein
MGQPTAAVVAGLAVEAEGVDAGEVLLGELNCVACHAAPAAVVDRLLPKPAPRLGQVVQRSAPGHLREFIGAPHWVKPGTLMPDLLHGRPAGEREADTDALVHFLASLDSQALGGPTPGNRLMLEQGRVLYHRTGCVACHAPQEAAAAVFPDPAGGGPTDAAATGYVLGQLERTSVPLGDLAAKYYTPGLTRFLLDPLAVRVGGRMPSLGLTEDEARAVAAYLVRSRPGPSGAPAPTPADAAPAFVVDPARADRGRALFAGLGCSACHDTAPQHARPKSSLLAPELGALRWEAGTGCLGTEPAPGVPRFALSDAQRGALRSMRSRVGSLGQPLPATARVARRLTAWNCFACHSRAGYGGPSPSRSDYFTVLTTADLGDEGRLPPHLGSVGNKLRPEWLREVLLRGAAVRPYMATRMPQFGEANVGPLVAEFLAADLPAGALPIAGPGDGDVEAGRRLVGVGAYACITCHNFGPHKSLGISVMDMRRMAHRLRYDWFHRYLLEPSALRPGTRMPSFWPEGQASLKAILAGDTEQQIRAIWGLLSLGDAAPIPPGLGEAASERP